MQDNKQPSFHEFCQHLIKKREEELKQNPALAEEEQGPLVDPIICGGIASIQVAEKDKEM